MITNRYELVVGLEIHAQLRTNTKIFTTDATTFGQAPNTQTNIVSLAHPGTLPKLNKKAVELAVRMGLACQSQISRRNIFDRKSYFYADLPKGFQLTQEKTPICIGGSVEVVLKSGERRNVQLNRIHLEEDAGKSIHADTDEVTYIDLNRAGVPLIEIVTEPVIRSAEEAAAYFAEIRKLVRYLDVCDGNMEEGSLRCDANVSVRPHGSTTLGNKVEIKNMNSIKHLQKAIEYEYVRQSEMAEKGEFIVSETRLFNPQNGKTYTMRVKETLTDYRYFPEPDLPPFVITDAYLAAVRKQMPLLPKETTARFVSVYGLPDYAAAVLTDDKATAQYYEAVCRHTQHYKAVANWLMGPVKSYLNEHNLEIEQFPLAPETLAALTELVQSNQVSFSVATQQLFLQLVAQPHQAPATLAEKLNLLQQSDDEFLRDLILQAVAKYPDKVAEYKKGKKNLLAMFMGEVMKLSKGKAEPKRTSDLLKEILER